MAIRLTISELIKLYSRREKKRLYVIAKEMGYESTNFYSKLWQNRWTIKDLQKIQEMYDVTLDDVLESVNSNIKHK